MKLAVKVGDRWGTWDDHDPLGLGGGLVVYANWRDVFEVEDRWRAEALAKELGGVVVEVDDGT